MVRKPSPRGAAARGWDVVGGRLALQAALLAVSLCADTRALLDAPPVAAREAALPRALYAALPHVQLRCTALSEWGAAAGGPGGRRGELEESAEAEAGRLGCLFVPFGAELHASAASEPSVSAASALFALAHHLNPLAGHAEPGALLADVVACVGLLVRHASADALNTAAEAVSSFFSVARGATRSSAVSTHSRRSNGCASMSMRPASIFEKSRMSLMIVSSVSPESRIVAA